MPKDENEEAEVLDDVDVDEEEEEEEEPTDETPEWADKLAKGQDAINKRLDVMEKPVEKEEEEEEEDDEPVKYEKGMSIDEFGAKLEDRAVKKALKLFEGSEKKKADAQGEVEKYYTGQIKRLGDRGKDVSEEVQRDVFRFMRENNITSFVEGYYEWEADGGKPVKPKKKDDDKEDDEKGIVQDKDKKNSKSRRIKGSGGDKTKSKKEKIYRPGRTVHDVLADIYSEDIE